MKSKIFDLMCKYGWDLEDNTDENFDVVLQYHLNRMNKEWSELAEKDNLINEEELRKEDLGFIIDFITAINELDKFKAETYEEKMGRLANEDKDKYEYIGN